MSRPLHLYLHVPFCARVCPYCHFAVRRHDGQGERAWLEGVEREIEAARRRGAFENARLATLYFGGGTPSTISLETFARAADLCRSVARPAQGLEWTLEANPEDVDSARLGAWREAGVNRLSVGAQSFEPRRLERLGRVHSAPRGLEALLLAAEAGFPDVSVDLMFGLAGEDRAAAWERDLRTALSLPISHLALWGLTVEPDTPFARRSARGERLVVPDDAFAEEYRTACRLAAEAGFEHYEVSCFAVPGRRSRHNAAVWSGASYLGLGPSAHSFDGERRWANTASLEGWAGALARGDDARAFVEEPDAGERAIETLCLALRTREGVSADHPLLRGPAARRLIAALRREGAIEDLDGRVRCTDEGFLLLDSILERLVALGGHDAVPAPARRPD